MRLRVLVHLLLAVTTPLVRAAKVAVGATGSQRRSVLAGGAATAKLREGLQLKAAGSYAAAAELIWEAIMTGVPDVPGAFAQYQACYALQGKLEWAFIDVARQYLAREDWVLAVRFLRQAIELREEEPEAHFLLGHALSSTNDLAGSFLEYTRAIELNATHAGYHYQLGALLFQTKRWDESLQQFERSHALDQDLAEAFANMVYLRTRVCEWADHAPMFVRLERMLTEHLVGGAGDGLFQDPHMVLAYPLPPSLKLLLAQSHAAEERQRALKEITANGTRPAPPPHSRARWQRRWANQTATRGASGLPPKIRVGFLSADFNMKATAYLVLHQFAHHDRERVEVFAYASTPPNSAGTFGASDWRAEIAADVDHFVDVSALSLEETVRLMRREHRLHVLINWDGYSNKGTRKEGVFALQPAPVQVAHLVYVGTTGRCVVHFFCCSILLFAHLFFCFVYSFVCSTTGSPNVQYIVSDERASPVRLEALYSEKFIWLPHSFFENSHAEIDALEPPRAQRRADAAGEVHFCNFNKHLKLGPDIFDAWQRILERVPGSALYMLHFPSASEPRLRRHWSLEPSRLRFLGFEQNPYEHQQRIGRICDVVLDNPVYNAHTMAVDCLYAGVPVVTWGDGTDMGGRVGLSIVHTLGLARELAANSTAQYVDVAVRLGTDPAFYTGVRDKLVATTTATPLNPFWDIRRYTRNLERGLVGAWENYLAGRHEHVRVVEE